LGRIITRKDTLDDCPVCGTTLQQRYEESTEGLIPGKLIELPLGRPFCPKQHKHAMAADEKEPADEDETPEKSPKKAYQDQVADGYDPYDHEGLADEPNR
jgi:hypothetical protein